MGRLIKTVSGFAVAAVSVLAFVASPVSAAVGAVYDATPAQLPPNVPSLGFEATATSELGDHVNLSKAGEKLNTVTVTMSTWATYSSYQQDERYAGNTNSWTHPVTVKVMAADTGEVLAAKTQDVAVPWRPAADPTCPNTGYGEGFAWRASDGECYNGYAFNANIDMSDLNVTLPQSVVVSVGYNTQHYGTAPLGVGGPYDSLNVAIPDNQTVSVGQDVDVDSVYWNSTYAGREAGLRADSGWTPNGTVALKLTAGTVDTQAPVVTITSPTDGAEVRGELTLAGTVTDETALLRYHYFVKAADGSYAVEPKTVAATGTNVDFSKVVNTLGWADGTYTFQLEARDAAGNKSLDTSVDKVTFTVNNVVDTKEQCKNNGWQTLVKPDKSGFKNQGQCVSFVQANENASFKRQ